MCLGTSPNHQAPPPPVGPPSGLNGGPRNAPDGLLMTANPQQQPPNGSTGGYYGMDTTPQQQPLNVQPGGGSGPAATNSPTGGGVSGDVANANNSVVGGIVGQSQQSQVPPGGQANGYMQQQQQQQANSGTAPQNYSTTGQGTWTGSNTLTYTQAMQPDMQRQQGNYCESLCCCDVWNQILNLFPLSCRGPWSVSDTQ